MVGRILQDRDQSKIVFFREHHCS